MTTKYIFLVLLAFISYCKGPDKPDSLPVISEEPMKTKEELTQNLKSPNFYERSQALVEITKTKDKSFLPEIRNLLKKDPNPAVKGSAAIALGEFGDTVSTPDIVNLFKDKDISTDTVLDALTRMKDPSAGNSIIPYLDSNDHSY